MFCIYVFLVLAHIPNPFVWLFDVIHYLCVLETAMWAFADVVWINKMSLNYAAMVFRTGLCPEFLACLSHLKETQIQECPVVFLNQNGYT